MTKKTPSQKHQAKIRKLRKEADKIWGEIILKLHPLCEYCGEKSKDPHHFVPKSISNILRYDIANGIGLCHAHHFHHHNGNPFILQQIIEQRGGEWFEYLKEQKMKSITTNLKWYEDNIKRLNKILLKIEKKYESKRPIK